MNSSQSINGSEIAIVGMSGRFPGANNVEAFWQNLREGVESVSFFSDEELIASGVDPSFLNNADYVKAKAILADVDRFDADFFGFSPKEAELMDPQHRLFLEAAWDAIENAGYNPNIFAGSIGVYAGVETNTYLINHLCPHFGGIPNLQTFLGNAADYLSTRVSYKLNLKGPSVTVQTACSTSLVAVHIACQSLLNGECDMALAGGVSVIVPQKTGYFYQQGGIASPDGHCRTFDARAQGSFFGNGMGIVVLKRLAEAIDAGDCIHAVIKGSAINNDGALKVGYTAPSPEGQAAVIAEAQAIAGIDPETITYIEAHGSGTTLGDPIEIAALTQVFRDRTDKKEFCAIGSVKTNFGHLSIAAGITGLIKTVLALKHQQIPPSLHFEQPNPKIDFANSPFYVNTQLSDWQVSGHPRRAGVSAFGLGGTNAHILLEEAPPSVASKPSRPWQVLPLSAKTSAALEKATNQLATHLMQHPHLNLADVAYTLQRGRQSFAYRRAVVCRDIDDAASALQDVKRVLTRVQEPIARPVAFMFTGLGTQYVNMAEELYQSEPIFREQVDRCCQFLTPLLGLDLRDILYPTRNQISSQLSASVQSTTRSSFNLRQMLGRDIKSTDAVPQTLTQTLNQTRLTQPAIFVVEYALAQLWMAWGIHPVAMMGYSIGEYVAACLAEVLSLEEALMLVAKRSQIIETLPPGAMLAVPLSEAEARLLLNDPLLNEKLSLSAINGDNLCVVAGATDAVEALATQLTTQGLACRRLQTSHAFHSQMMQPIAAACTEIAKSLHLKPPQIPFLSNVTGTWITAAQATDPGYWAAHLCQPVRFADGVNELWKQYQPILLEIGAGQTLSSLALQCLERNSGNRIENESDHKTVNIAEKIALPSLRDLYNQTSDRAFLLNTVAQLWLSGVSIDWSKFYVDEHRHRLPLPTYPFERQRYWIDPPKLKQATPVKSVAPERKSDPADWFYMPIWKQSMPPIPFAAGILTQPFCWLVFVDEYGIGCELVHRLESEHQTVIQVRMGKQFAWLRDREYTLNPRSPENYTALLQDLRHRDLIPNAVIHAWSISPNETEQPEVQPFEQFAAAQYAGFYSLLFFVQAIGQQIVTESLNIWVLSNGMQAVESRDIVYPEKATILGLCQVAPQEYPNITCRSIDLMLPNLVLPLAENQIKNLIASILAELVTPSDLKIAYRGDRRWIQNVESVRFDQQPTRLRQAGVYLITGGLGKLGLILAKYLAQTVQAKLVLVGRSGLPAPAEWEQWLDTHDRGDRTTTRILQVQELEALGAEVLVIPADVADQTQMQAVITQAEERFGQIHGVIHAAGIVAPESFKAISETNYADSELHFQPKGYGLYTLEQVLRGKKLDYCFLISSISSLLGGLGFAAYSAANIFLDVFAHRQNSIDSRHWCSINWFLIDNPEETVKAFQRILSNALVTQVAISPTDLNVKMAEWMQRRSWQNSTQQDTKETDREETQSLHSRSNQRHPYVAPSRDTERQIAQRYQQLLGIELVGIHDNFFDLGGHSLLGTQLISQLRQDFQVELPITLLFKAPSVAELALVIEDMLIGELEALSEEEAEQLLSADLNR